MESFKRFCQDKSFHKQLQKNKRGLETTSESEKQKGF